MLDVSAEEFRSSRNRQEAAAEGVGDSSARRLLLFYAVECGGKYQLLVNERKHLFSKLSDEDKGIGHDLLKLLKRIGLEKNVTHFRICTAGIRERLLMLRVTMKCGDMAYAVKKKKQWSGP